MPRKAKTKKNKKKRSGQHNNSDGYDEPEIWDLKRQIRRNQECGCHTPGCTEQAIAVWASNKTTAANEWFTCEECQLKDFGGWPEGEVPVNNDSNINNALKKKARKKIASAVAKPRKTRKSGNDDKETPSIEKQASTISGSAAKKGVIVSSAISDVIVNDGDGKELAATPKNGSARTRITPLSSNTFSGGKESSFKTPSLEQRQVVQRVVTPLSPLMSMEKPERNLATIRYCTGQDRQDWTRWQPLYSIPCRSTKPEEPFVCNLRRGGTVKIYPNLVQTMETERVKEELFDCGFFRQYQIQAQDEPRLHFLLNERATEDNFETISQPGYRYAGVKMKARPLKILPELEQLSQRLATVSGVNRWTIGVNPVLYRDCRDKMGSHADDDQGEQIILCLIVASPQEARRIIISPKDKKPNLEAGDETIELILQPGDAYEMDGEMQQYYVHSVPKEKETKEEDNSSRIAIVFRTGEEVSYPRDSGRPCTDLSPRTPKFQVFGNHIPGLVEGYVYPRCELFIRCAHLMQQRGISGNMTTGADAIIVSGLREDGLGIDHFLKLMYAVESAKGGNAVVTSYKKNLPIRVFRSSTYNSSLRALRQQFGKACQTVYRYDGLYRVVSFQEPSAPKGPFKFELHRIDAGSDEMSNRISNSELADYCCRLGTIMDENKRDFFESAQQLTTTRSEETSPPDHQKRSWEHTGSTVLSVQGDNEDGGSSHPHQQMQTSLLQSNEKRNLTCDNSTGNKKQKCSLQSNTSTARIPATSAFAASATGVWNHTVGTLASLTVNQLAPCIPLRPNHNSNNVKHHMFSYTLSYEQAAARQEGDLQMAAARLTTLASGITPQSQYNHCPAYYAPVDYHHNHHGELLE